MERRNIEEIIKQHHGQRIVILAKNPEEVLQLREGRHLTNRQSALQTTTPLQLALEVLEPDIEARGLKVIPEEKILDILAKTTASLDERRMFSRWGGSRQIASLLPGIYEHIIKIRRFALGEQILAVEWGDDCSSLLGLILNEYELNLESWGCLDEAAVFRQAAAILEAGIIDGSGRIIVVMQETELEPVVLNFLKVFMEHGCQRGYGMELLIPINNPFKCLRERV